MCIELCPTIQQNIILYMVQCFNSSWEKIYASQISHSWFLNKKNPSRECLSSYIESHVVVGGSILKVLAGEIQDILQD